MRSSAGLRRSLGGAVGAVGVLGSGTGLAFGERAKHQTRSLEGRPSPQRSSSVRHMVGRHRAVIDRLDAASPVARSHEAMRPDRIQGGRDVNEHKYFMGSAQERACMADERYCGSGHRGNGSGAKHSDLQLLCRSTSGGLRQR